MVITGFEGTERDEIGYENTEYDKVRGYVGSYDASSSYGGSGKESRYRGRGKVTEFRHSRGDRRGSGRGRAGYPFRADRDPTENTYKYQEWLGHSNADTWNQTSGGKFYEKSELAVNLPEDPRISKLLRRLCAEVDVEKSLIICRKLQEAVMLPENARYIRRSYDILVESLLDVLYDGPGPETKENAAIVLGRIGYVMGSDYRKHLDWIASQYSVHNSSSIKHLLTLSFSETFQLDYETSNLNEHAKLTMEHLQNIIEGTDSPDIFIAAINSMIIMSNSYPEHFVNHFIDTVDILVGWHVDNTQPKKIKDFALQSLLKLSRHWQADVGFSINLLNQFIEDMVVYANILQRDPNEKAVDTNDDITSEEDCIQKLTSFLNVFNSVVKSLGALLSPNASQTVTWTYLTETMTKVLEVIAKVIRENADEDLIIAELAQNCVVLKLRTPLGKPQETFMKIEGALKAIAREISSSDSKYVALTNQKLIDVIVGEQSRSRWISEFMMFLEKYIYNAAEGTAIVLPAVTKPVKTFFHTNWSTCREWLTRVRPAALAVSLYAGHLGAAIYHGQVILQVTASSATNIDIEAITISTARALIKLQETDVLHGLYVWINKTFGKKYHWLKAAADQANSKYELSVDTYRKLKKSVSTTQDEKDSSDVISLGSKTSHFIDEQIMESYKNLQDWEDMREWTELEYENKCISQWDSFYCLELFEGNVEIPSQLGDWDVIDLKTTEINKNQSSYQGLINKIESTLVYTAVNMYYEESKEKYETLLNDCNELLNATFEEFTRDNSTFFLKDISVLQLATKGLRNMIQGGKTILNPFKPSSIKDYKFGTTFDNLSRIFWWNQYFAKLNLSEENAYYAECLRLDVIRGARKSSNLKMANRELLKHFKHNTTFQMYLGDLNTLDELSDVFLMSSNTYELDIWSLNNVIALMEFCKLTYENETTKTRAIDLCASISLGLSQRLAMGEQSYELREKGTRMLLTLSKWVQTENVLIGTQDSPLTKLVTALPEIGLVDNKISENVIPLSDSAVGKLLQFSVNQCPGLAKAWANFAAWCFRWGRKMVEYSSKTGDQLTDSDKLQIESVMIGCSPQDYEAVCEILSKTKATCDDEDIDWNEINTSDMIESQLRTVPSLSHAFSEHLALLVDIWRQAQKRVFSYFELSADAYFKFLQLICASDYINHSGEYAVVSATLRLLRLIVKHAMELQTVLESGLANTPTQPWKVIIPQLFSRLNHPETYVRKCVSDLLCRLAEDTPHLITFPAVVGAVENEQRNIAELNVARSYISNDTESGGQHFSDCDETGSDKIVNNELNSCFLDMVETLANQAPTTILQVKLLVKELQRINLLWDELWLGTLVQHHSEFGKRLTQLETEIAKVKNNLNLNSEEKVKLIKEKHRIIFEPIVVVLEQLNQITSAKAETPHESYFQAKFQLLINEVIDKLKNPVNPDKPQESWAPLKQLQIKLQQKVNKRASYVLKMTDISPVLAGLKNTVISMPGVQTHQRAVRVTMKSIENNVAILPTKTRPKKLVFHGSDGKSYTYLFKGLEDLHLDERIMQLLSIVNTMMARDSENNENQTYRARHYSVIPLGPRSGLISWVDNVTPLFALYKRWQNREAAILSAKRNKTVNVLRPSELFYNKLNPLLQEAGVTMDNRKEWPLSVLKQVLTELSTETPRDLLWRELWCGSVTPEQWWQMVRRYSYSVAVMSTIGYIIGLGDRHLDNVLVDLTSGEVVHIDYNVCFEKGKTLRVPEKVPFRMTPNLVTALGVTGVEGSGGGGGARSRSSRFRLAEHLV
ncbi:hypothetical protein EVAR_88413_1 [Eumeta japonica]|uniref:non-specific serine/threonine protein kinase n=1 Tax=Eumeta variegata TaxID=151549 RepID=A0A4C1Y295_EUMVA|nr:hypothetical protein EVAR_88413_1 [Eumeta japonica]